MTDDDEDMVPTEEEAQAIARAWAGAQRDYWRGSTGPEVCARYGLKLSTFRRRAATEGFRRRDQPEIQLFDEGLAAEGRIAGDTDRLDYRHLSEIAYRRMARDILRGAAASALRWKRVYDLMSAEQMEVNRWLQEEACWEDAVRDGVVPGGSPLDPPSAYVTAEGETFTEPFA